MASWCRCHSRVLPAISVKRKVTVPWGCWGIGEGPHTQRQGSVRTAFASLPCSHRRKASRSPAMPCPVRVCRRTQARCVEGDCEITPCALRYKGSRGTISRIATSPHVTVATRRREFLMFRRGVLVLTFAFAMTGRLCQPQPVPATARLMVSATVSPMSRAMVWLRAALAAAAAATADLTLSSSTCTTRPAAAAVDRVVVVGVTAAPTYTPDSRSVMPGAGIGSSLTTHR